MAEQIQSAAPRSFWITSGLALVWNLIGFANYLVQVTMSEDALMKLPDAERMLMESTPAWATGAFALSVNAGVLGCLLLLLRKSWAMPVLILSLVSVVVLMYHWVFMTNSQAVYGPAGLIMPALVTIIAVLLVWYSRYASNKGWIS